MNVNKRIASKQEVETVIAQLSYALTNKTRITFQEEKNSDIHRNVRFTNQYTIANLFSDEPPQKVLRREIGKLCPEEYMHSVKDTKYPNRSELHVFAREYDDYVYIKFRVEVIVNNIYVISFHYSDVELNNEDFPYREEIS